MAITNKLTAIANAIRSLLGTSITYTMDTMASTLNGIARRTDSGNATLNRSTTSKSYAAGYYPNAHGAQHSLGTEGTPTASKVVSNNVATVTPSVTNTEGYIAGGAHSGTPVTVSPADLGAVVPSGTKAITANGTFDVTQFASASVDLPFRQWTYVSTGTSAQVYEVLIANDDWVKVHYNDSNLVIVLLPKFKTSYSAGKRRIVFSFGCNSPITTGSAIQETSDVYSCNGRYTTDDGYVNVAAKSYPLVANDLGQLGANASGNILLCTYGDATYMLEAGEWSITAFLI